MKNKKSLLILSSCLAVTLCSAVAYTTVSAEIGVKTEPTTLALESGARVKFGTKEGGNGLRYTLQMDKSEYAKFMGSGYTDVTFGVLIAPEFYQTKYGAFDEANVFGIGENAQAIYDWATWGDTDGDGENSWEYSGTLTRIINLSTTELVEFTKESTTLVQYKGSIVDLDVASITGEFRGVGYVTYKDEGELKCKMVTGDNVRTMAYVANEAIKGYQDDLLNDELTEDEIKAINDKISLLNTNYMTKISDVEYKVNHHYVNVDGTETVDTEDLSAKATTLIEVAPKASEYFTYDKDNEDNVLKGIAKTGAEFDVYYTQNTKALTDAALTLDVDSTTSLTIPESVSTSVTNALIGGVSVMSALDGTTLTLSNVDKLAPNGLTTITYVTDTYAYTQEVDVYTLNGFETEDMKAEGTMPLASNLYTYNDAETTVLPEFEGETNVYKAKTLKKAESAAVMIKPRHASATYKALHAKYNLYMSFRLYIEGDSETYELLDFGGGVAKAKFEAGKWHTFVVPMNEITTEIDCDEGKTTRLEQMAEKWYYQSINEKAPGDVKMGDMYWMRGSLAYTKTSGEISFYITEPRIHARATEDVLLESASVSTKTLATVIGETYPGYYISSLNIDNVDCTPTEKTELSGYSLENFAKGAHKVTVTLQDNLGYENYAYNGSVVVLSAIIDVYNLADGLEYAPITTAYNVTTNVNNTKYHNEKLANVISVKTAADVTADTAVTMGEYVASGNYYYYDTTTSTTSTTAYTEHGLWVKAMHSKAYYELMKTLGYTAITYDYYIVDPEGLTGGVQYNGLSQASAKKNAWQTATISIDNIIEYYATYSSGAAYYPNYPDLGGGHYRYTELIHTGWKSSHEAKFYVGNFGSVKA